MTDIPKATPALRDRVLRPHDPLVTDAELAEAEEISRRRSDVIQGSVLTYASIYVSDCDVSIKPDTVGDERFIVSFAGRSSLFTDLRTLVRLRAAIDELLS